MSARKFCRRRSCANRPSLPCTGSAAGAHLCGTLSDPARGDLDLIDPLSRRVEAHYGWMFPRAAFISGVRPDILDLVSIDSPPAWFAETGWHLTPETLNISEQQGRAEGIAHIRNRPDTGTACAWRREHAGGGREAGSRIACDRRSRDRRWDVAPGARFFKRILLEPGTLAGDGPFTRLVVSYKGADGRPERVRLTQLMIASPQSVFHVEHTGWNESEYSDQMQRRWRWTTDSGRDLRQCGWTRSHAEDRRRVTAAVFRYSAPRHDPRGHSGIGDGPAVERLRAQREGARRRTRGLGWDADDRNGSVVRAARPSAVRIGGHAGIADFRPDDSLIAAVQRSWLFGFFRQTQQRAAERHVDARLDKFRFQRQRAGEERIDRRGRHVNGTGTGTLMPIIPTSTSFWKRRAAPPSLVKIAVPLP